MTDKMARIAVAGFGRWGKNHVRNYHNLGVLEAIVESDEAARARAREAYPDVRVLDSLSAALADDGLSGVVIATPAATHADLAQQALLAGKDVLVEKPLALTVAAAESLVKRAAELGRILMVGHLLEYHPGLVEVARLVHSGAVGQLRYVTSRRLNMGTIRTEENVLWSFAPHDVTLLVRLAGTLPESVSTTGGAWVQPSIVDYTWASLRFPGGVHGQIESSWLHPFKEHRLVVVGDEGMLSFEDKPGGAELLRWDHVVDFVDGQPVVRKADSEVLPVPTGEPLRAECQAFLDAIATRRSPLTDGESGLGILRVLEACQGSMDAGGVPTPVDERPSASGGAGFFVHPTAVVDEGAQIGEGARVWHFSHVMGSAVLGERANLGQNVFIGPSVTVGAGCKLQNNVSVYEGVELAEEVFCGPSMVFTNVRNPRSHVDRKGEFVVTRVGRRATLGANATVVCGTTLGAYCFVAAGAVVTRDVPAYALVAGSPARIIGWMCGCGERLKLDADAASGTKATCGRCGASYEMAKDELLPSGSAGQ